jgi:hypothetical protein
MGAWIVIFAVIVAVLLLVYATGKRSPRDGGSTAGHYDPDAIGGYTLDPATLRFRYDLPTLPRAGPSAAPGGGPRRRGRRRRRRPDTEAS